MSDLSEISVQDLPASAPVLDVREDDEWAAGRRDGAVHIPLSELPTRLDELPDSDPLYVMCRSGYRSGRAVQWLSAQGIESVNITGGMKAWAAAGLPMTSDSGEPTVI